jgi:putative membrane protein insertion efficiency factor
VCKQVCGQKNLSEEKASAYLGRNREVFTKTWILRNLKKSLKTFKASIFFIKLYQVTLSPYLGGRCRYYPSCSNYAIECFERFGFLRASAMTAKRLCSCHPLSKNKDYYDPVPLSLKGIS